MLYHSLLFSCILASFIYILKKAKKKVYFMYFHLKKQKIFFWYFIMAYFLYHIHGIETLLFTCRYQRFLDSQALSLNNRSSEYPSHSWSQMLPAYLYQCYRNWTGHQTGEAQNVNRTKTGKKPSKKPTD